VLIEPRGLVAAIEQDHHVNAPVALGIVVFPVPFPDDLSLDVFRSEYSVHQELEIMARGGIAMEIKAPRGLQDSPKFYEAGWHHDQVGHHVRLAED
jgi:hypothetical protein